MTIPLQADITIARARIHSLQPSPGGVTIRTEHGERHFPGCFALPGFVDSHAHIIGLGMKLLGLALYDCTSAQECIRRAQDYGTNANNLRGDWISGMGWNQELWTETSLPTKELLDEFFPSTPVYLRRADGHAAWVNSEALRRANITSSTPQPNGGEILHNVQGEPSGILVDNAMELVAAHLPPFSSEQIQACILAAMKECSRVGLTEIHDMDVSCEALPLFREMAERGDLSCRVQSWVRGQNKEWLEQGVLPAVGEFQQTVGVKFYADGALGSRGAALLEPYSDMRSTMGLFLLGADELYERCVLAIEQGFHIATHAIGDAANRMVLNVYQRLREKSIADEHTLLRIEHSQIVHPSDRVRFGKYRITAPVQPVHCISDAPMAEKRLGERCSYGYPWRSLLEEDVMVAGGSDFPIESHNPLTGIDAFCRRLPLGASEAWYPQEILTREEALTAYTLWAHKAADQQYRRGSLASGKDADIVIVDRNLATCPDEEILQTTIVATYSAGVLRYEG